MKDLPACRECKRTHTSRGNPVKLAVRGERVGLCSSCVQALRRQFGSESEPGRVESDARALEYWLNTVYRPRRRVSRPLSR